MKLYLSSQKLGNSPTHLLKLLKNNNTVIVANALDDKPKAHRDNRVENEIQTLKSIGLNPEELDLRNYFSNPEKLSKYLKSKSLIWVRGGNTFILRRAMLESNFDQIVLPLIKNNKLVYGGYSAALLVASKDLFGVELVDNPNLVPKGYSRSIQPKDGLGLLDFHLIPHFESNEPYAKDIVQHRNCLHNNGRCVVTLRDGEVYVFNNGRGEIIK